MRKLILCVFIACLMVSGCGQIKSPSPELGLPTASKGYVVYVYAKKTELMIDFCKSDGISRGTKLDVFKMDALRKEPVKLGEIVVEKVGDKMSRAKVIKFTSSIPIAEGDRVFPHPIIIVTDDSWITHRNPVDGWKSEFSIPNERDWEKCEIVQRDNRAPEIRQLVVDTDAKPIWHPSVKSRTGDVFFRKIFKIDAEPTEAKLEIICGGRANIYLNDRWVGEVEDTKEFPKKDSFNVKTFLRRGKNLIAIQAVRDVRTIAPPLLYLALSIQTEFQ